MPFLICLKGNPTYDLERVQFQHRSVEATTTQNGVNYSGSGSGKIATGFKFRDVLPLWKHKHRDAEEILVIGLLSQLLPFLTLFFGKNAVIF